MDNVEVRQWVGPLDDICQIPVFHHQLSWLDRPCVPGIYDYLVKSSRGGIVKESFEQTVRVRLCTSLDPDDPINQP